MGCKDGTDLPADYKASLKDYIAASGNEKEIEKAVSMANKEELPLLYYMICNMSSYDLCNITAKGLIRHVKTTVNTNKHVPWQIDENSDLFKNYVLSNRVSCESVYTDRYKMKRLVFPIIKNASSVPQATGNIIKHFANELFRYEIKMGTAYPHDYTPIDAWKFGGESCRARSDFMVEAFRSVGIPACRVECIATMHNVNTHTSVAYYNINDKSWHPVESNDSEPGSDSFFNTWQNAYGSTALYANPSYPKEDYFSTRNYEQLFNFGNHKYPSGSLTFIIKGNNGKRVNIAVYVWCDETDAWQNIARLKTDSKGNAQMRLGANESFYGTYPSYLISAGVGDKFASTLVSLSTDEKKDVTIDLNEKETPFVSYQYEKKADK